MFYVIDIAHLLCDMMHNRRCSGLLGVQGSLSLSDSFCVAVMKAPLSLALCGIMSLGAKPSDCIAPIIIRCANLLSCNFIFPVFVDDAHKYNAFSVTPHITMQDFGM